MASVPSLSFDSGFRVFVTECDPLSALQACLEGVQSVDIKTVVPGSMPEPGKNFGMHLTDMPDVHREGRKIFTSKLGSCCFVLFVWRFQ